MKNQVRILKALHKGGKNIEKSMNKAQLLH